MTSLPPPMELSRHAAAHLGHGLLALTVCLAGCGSESPPTSPRSAPPPEATPTAAEAVTPAPPPVATTPGDTIETESLDTTPRRLKPPSPSPVETAARELLSHLIAGRFAEAVTTFSPEVLEALPAEKLKTTWKTVQTQVGLYQSVAETATELKIQDNRVVDLLCTFEKAPLVFRLSYNDKQKVVGIFFRPPPNASPLAEPAKDRAGRKVYVTLKTGSGTLTGRIDWPTGDGPFPAVLVISGSGPNDRDGNQPGLESDYLKKLGSALASNGIAVLRFDKRGSGGSQITKSKARDLRFKSMIDDARGWIRLMTRNKNISRIGIIGHSQGSLVALLTAQKVKVSAVVSIAGAGQPIAKILERQLTTNLATMPKLRDQALAILRQLTNGKKVDEVPEALATVFRPDVQPFLMSWMKYDPTAIIAKTTTPTLIVQGTRDAQVTVRDAEALKAAQKSAALVLIEDMNHVLRHIRTDAEQLPSYSNAELPLAPELIPALFSFLEQELVAEPSR
jgi:alpha-beta hydrolase superfamily lysophospholipase